MRKSLRLLFILASILWTVLLTLLLVTLRYILRTPKPLQSALSGDAHLYKWTQGHVYYHIQGAPAAPPLVLLHTPAIAASAYSMRALMDGLAKHYQVYALDLLGFGLSDHPVLAYSADMYVQLGHDFLKEVVGRPATLVATGLSCNYSVAIAKLEPTLCERLVLLSPTALLNKRAALPWFAPVLAQPLSTLMLYAILTRRPLLRRIIAWQHGYSAKSITDAQLAHYSAVAHQFGAEHAPMAEIAGKLQLDVTQQIEQISQPVLLLWGVHALNDQISLLSQHDFFTHLQLRLVHNAGLSVQEEQPQAVISHILAWLPSSKHEDATIEATALPETVATTSMPEPTEQPIIATPSVQPEAENNVDVHTEPPEGGEQQDAATQPTMEAYCMKCKQKRPMQHPTEVVTKTGRHALEDRCPVCGTKLFRFIASQEE